MTKCLQIMSQNQSRKNIYIFGSAKFTLKSLIEYVIDWNYSINMNQTDNVALKTYDWHNTDRHTQATKDARKTLFCINHKLKEGKMVQLSNFQKNT
jgi:hypothetical protein